MKIHPYNNDELSHGLDYYIKHLLNYVMNTCIYYDLNFLL